MFSVTIFILFVTAYAHPHSYTLNNAVSFDDILPSSTYAEDNPIDLTPQNVIADAAATDPCIDYDTRPLFVKCGGPEIGRPKVWTLNTPIPYVLDCLPGDKQRRVRVAREAPYCCVESSVQGEDIYWNCLKLKPIDMPQLTVEEYQSGLTGKDPSLGKAD